MGLGEPAAASVLHPWLWPRVGALPRLRRWVWFWLAGLLIAIGASPRLPAQAISEYQIKAVFLFNFAQFVEWPPAAFAGPEAPLVIGVVGEDPFGAMLDDTVRGEQVHQRPVVVRRFRRVEDVDACHVLFISRSEMPRLDQVLGQLRNRPILTVGDVEGFALRGGMIRFVMENNKVKMRINPDSAKAAGLVISSKLLRPATIVSPGKD